MAQHFPQDLALVLPDGTTLSYSELWQQVQSLRLEIKKRGLKSGDRVLVLFPFDEKFVQLIIALFAEKIVPVLLDPRVPMKFWRQLLKDAQVHSIFLNRKIKRWRFLIWWLNWFRLISIENILVKSSACHDPILPTNDLEEVLVSLTSGTTGRPKIISRNFQTIQHQQLYLCKHLPALKKDIHLALYGMGTLQSLVEGATTLLLPTKLQNSEKIAAMIRQHQVTRLSGPPGTISEFLIYLRSAKISLPNLQNLISGGAPLPRWWFQWAQELLPHCNVDVMYGSTECEPISFYTSKGQEEPPGYPVGFPISELLLTQRPFARVENLEIFEVILQGKNCVSNSSEGLVTGDLAHMQDNCLYLLGRKSEAIQEIPIGLLEEPLERLLGIKRVASYFEETLLTFFYETLPDVPIAIDFAEKATQHGKKFGFSNIEVRQVEKIPVDARHGWKIQRRELKSLF
jgi:acyl-CoA synthetase (AMP-forming)/AMP-acid ligase II